MIDPEAVDSHSAHLSASLKGYLFLLVFLAPMDYVRPTALLLREVGARPAILLMTLASCWIFIRHWKRLLFFAPPRWVGIVRTFLWIGFCGTLAFLINISLGISYTDGKRHPLEQFVGQAFLFALVPFILIAHAELFRKPGAVRFAMQVIPAVLLIHLAFVGIEALKFLDPMKFPLDMFRPPTTISGRRPSGLMTEPSYIAVMAGIYGPVCLLFRSPKGGTRLFRFLICAAAVSTCLALGAKTIVPVAAASVAGWIWQRRISLKSPAVLLALCAIAALAMYNLLTYSALNVEDNLSSAMRLGSAMLAWNVARAGYGILGVGFGQFHFLYNVRYAPWFLTYSSEATELFSRFADTRASTYNLFLRYLVETGVTGTALFLSVLFRLLRDARRCQANTLSFGAIMMCGSLGFLFTQDPYCFPMFLMGAAVLMTVRLPDEMAEANV